MSGKIYGIKGMTSYHMKQQQEYMHRATSIQHVHAKISLSIYMHQLHFVNIQV